MSKGNIYKPRYSFANRSRSKITIYKDGYLRRFYERRGRRAKRGGLFRRYVLVANNRKWTKARRFIRPVRRQSGLRINRTKSILLNGRPVKRKYITSFFQKQRLRYFYGKRKESSFRAAFTNYRTIQGVTSRSFFSILESRLDRTLYRRRLFPTLYGCRQFIHYHGVLLNDSIEKSPRYQVDIGDSLAIPNFAWRSVYWDLFCSVYYRRWGRYIAARRFYSRFKKKIFKFRWLSFNRAPRTRNIQKKYWFNFGSPFSRAKTFNLFQKNNNKLNRSRGKRIYLWKWLNQISSSKKNKKSVHNPFLFSKVNRRGHVLLRQDEKKSFDVKTKKNRVNHSYLKLIQQRRARSRSIVSSKKNRNVRFDQFNKPVGRRMVRRSFAFLSQSFQPNAPTSQRSEINSYGLDRFRQGNSSANKVFKNSFLQHSQERNRANDKFYSASEFQLFLDQRNTDADRRRLEAEQRQRKPKEYTERSAYLINSKREKFATFIFNQKFRKKFIPHFAKKSQRYSNVNFPISVDEKQTEPLSKTSEMNPIIKRRLRTTIHSKRTKKSIKKGKLAQTLSNFSSSLRRQKKYRRARRYGFNKGVRYTSYLRRQISRFFRRSRYRIRRNRSYPRLKRTHRYFPSYIQTDLRTLRRVKISTPGTNSIYSGFRLSPARIYSFYKSRGY